MIKIGALVSENGGGWAALIVGALVIYSCSKDERLEDGEGQQTSYEYSSEAIQHAEVEEEAVDESEGFDEGLARELAEKEIANESYVSAGSPYGCTQDCSGHEAGFRWRAEHGYTGYSASSQSFNEGGQAFDDSVDARVEEMRSNYQNGEELEY